MGGDKRHTVAILVRKRVPHGPTGLRDHQDGRCDVPRFEPQFEVGIKEASGYVTHIDGPGSCPANIADLRNESSESGALPCSLLGGIGKASTDERIS